MQTVIDNFNERVAEIDAYIKLLEQISEPTAKIKADGKRPVVIGQVALKTMKASCFLMLYNLVEFSIKDSMTKLYERVNSENKAIIDFDEFVKELWVQQKFKDLDPFSSNQTSYRNLIKDMVDDVISNSPILLNSNRMPISGNLDARKIRQLFIQHKIPINVHYRAFGGGELKTIKDNRNSLSHGSESFSDCGQQYTVQSIKNIKTQAVVYLRSSLRNVKKYIDEAKYAA